MNFGKTKRNTIWIMRIVIAIAECVVDPNSYLGGGGRRLKS
jgi:hypothetical protein